MSRVFNLSKYNTLVGNDLSLNEKLQVRNDVSLNADVDISSKLKVDGNWTSIVLMEGFAEVEENKVTILCNGAEEGSTIDRAAAQEELEKVTLLVDQATTKKDKIDLPQMHEIYSLTFQLLIHFQ